MREQQFVSAKNESPRIFKNNLLDYFSRAHPILVPIVFLPVVGWFAFQAFSSYGIDLTSAIIWGISGLIVWTLFEYFLHRYLFHLHIDSDFGRKLHFYVHGVHHDYPNDALRLVIPPAASVILAVVMYWFFYAFIIGLGGTFGQHNIFYASFVFGYIVYDMMHYATHYYNFKAKWFQTIKRNHLDHHYVNHDKGFGLSNVFWDRVFRTEQDSIKRKRK